MSEELEYTPTAEEVQAHYDAALDSVNLINGDRPEDISDAEWSETLDNNVRHLEIMVEKDFWNGQVLTPLRDAITAGKSAISDLS